MELQKKKEEEARLSGAPHLVNLNEDVQMSRKVHYEILPDNEVTVGKRGSEHEIQLGGAGIEQDMCKFTLLEDGKVTISPYSDKAALMVRVNGKVLLGTEAVTLRSNDRIALGPHAIFLFK